NVAVTPVKNADGKIEYYTYALPANSSNYTLHATWQESLNIKVIKKIAGNNVTSLAGSNINVGIYVGSLNMPTAADGSIDNRYTQSLTNYALGTTTPPASVNYAGLIPLTSSPQEMVTVYDLPKYTANGQSIGYQANEFGLASQGATLKKVETETTNECGTSITYTFTNEIPMVTLRVTKEVTGNAGDKTKQFPFRISYLNENIETSLRDTETYEASIPLTAVVQQSTFSVSVSEEHGSDYTATIRSNKSATVNESYSTDSTGNNQHTFDLVIQNVASLQGNDVIELVVTNDKNVPIPTGIETGVNMLQGMVIIGVSALLIVMLLLVRQSRYKQVF
ncbi:MAG: hypothetical protein IJV62_01360, partial [Eggerthellaceae bacterium]|nr:hypothetical protein [Eggerthellaceae bacterium]